MLLALALAPAWAKEHGYILTTMEFEEAYRLRFQTQMPVQSQFWTNGPSKRFVIGNAITTVTHVSESELYGHSLPIGRIYRAMLSLNPKHTSSVELERAFKLLYKSREEIIEAIKRLTKQSQMKEWHKMLKSLIA